MARAECDYTAPAFVHDELEVRLAVGDLGRSSFAFLYEIANVATGRIIATGKSITVAFDYARGASVPIPDAFRARLEEMRTNPTNFDKG
jgi:acyl-CoA thioester hydrolase